MSKPKIKKCCICNNPLPKGDLGYNPSPIKYEGSCCNECYRFKVVPARHVDENKREETINGR